MQPRTCPKCGYQYSRLEYFKELTFKFVFSNWKCKSCSEELTFNKSRRFLVGLFAGLTIIVSGLLSRMIENFEEPFYLQIFTKYGLSFILVFYAFTFDKFKLNNKE